MAEGNGKDLEPVKTNGTKPQGHQKGVRLTEEHRAKIKTTQILERLQGFALSLLDPITKAPIEMSAVQVTAAIALLKKSLPDLAQVEHTGEVDHRHRVVSDAPITIDQWEARHGNSLGAPGGTPESAH